MVNDYQYLTIFARGFVLDVWRWWWWWWIVFVVWLTERRLALFPAGTIIRDLHHHESPTRREQDLNVCRTWDHSGFVEWSCRVIITTTPRRHNAFNVWQSCKYTLTCKMQIIITWKLSYSREQQLRFKNLLVPTCLHKNVWKIAQTQIFTVLPVILKRTKTEFCGQLQSYGINHFWKIKMYLVLYKHIFIVYHIHSK